MTDDFFDLLCEHFGEHPDRRGEVYVDCPFCGKESSRRDVHFSFSERGGHCFVCGESCSLKRLAEHCGLIESNGDSKYLPRARRKKAKPKPQVKCDFEALAAQYERSPSRYDRWYSYRQVPDELVDAYRLGWGAWPQHVSKCSHYRLQVPLIAGGKVVGFRGRWSGCECDPAKTKWLSPAGTVMPLYNGERLGIRGPSYGYAVPRAKSDRLIITENPIDAIQFERLHPEFDVVATMGVSIWRDEWTGVLAKSGYRDVIVLFDNDRPGNGGGVAGRKAWLDDPKHNNRDILPNGIKLANRLARAGIKVRLFDWGDAPLKSDLGDIVKEESAKRLTSSAL